MYHAHEEKGSNQATEGNILVLCIKNRQNRRNLFKKQAKIEMQIGKAVNNYGYKKD